MKHWLTHFFAKHRLFRVLELAYTGGAVVLARVASIFSLIYAARLMEPKEYAGLVYAIGLSQIIVHLGSLGWFNLIRKESSRFEFHSAALVKGFIIRSFQLPVFSILFVVVFIGLILCLGSVPAPISIAVVYALILSAPLLLVQILREYMVSYKSPVASVVLSETVPLMVMLLLFVALKIETMGAAIACVFVSQIFGLLLQIYVMMPYFKEAYTNRHIEYRTVEWAKLAGLTVIGYGGRLLMDRMDTLMIAPMVGMEKMAIFNSTSKIAAVVLLMSIVLIQFYSPHVARAFRVSDSESLRKIICRQMLLITLALFPVVMVLFLYPVDVMVFIFGARYQEGANILWLSVISNILLAYALPFSSFLLMADGERAYAAASFLGLVVYAILCWILIPLNGIYGASISLLIATVIMFIFLIKPALSKMQVI